MKPGRQHTFRVVTVTILGPTMLPEVDHYTAQHRTALSLDW